MKITNIDKETLHIFWMTWAISIKCLEKMWLGKKIRVLDVKVNFKLFQFNFATILLFEFKFSFNFTA